MRDIFQYIASDLFRYAGKTNFLSFIKIFLARKSFRATVVYRLCQN